MALPFGNPFNRQQQTNVQQNQNQNQHQAGNGQQQQQPQNNQNTNLNQNNGQQGQSGMYPQGQNNNQQQSNQNQNQQGGGDPLMDFTKLWNNDTNTQGQQNQPAPKKGYVPEFQRDQLEAAVSQFKFARKALTPERQAAIMAGGEGAVAAMVDMMDAAFEQATMVNFTANRNLMDRSLTAAETGFLDKVPANVRDVMTQNSIQTSNPLMRDPQYSGMVDIVRQQAQSKYPKATPDQIQQVVNGYFDKMYSDMSGIRQQQQDGANSQDNNTKLKIGAQDADWNEWVQDGQEDLMQSIFQNDNTQNYQPQTTQQNSPNQAQNQFQQNQGQNQQGNYTLT